MPTTLARYVIKVSKDNEEEDILFVSFLWRILSPYIRVQTKKEGKERKYTRLRNTPRERCPEENEEKTSRRRGRGGGGGGGQKEEKARLRQLPPRQL